MATASATQTNELIRGGAPTVFITDMSRAVRFYNEALGLKIAYRADDHFCMIDAGDGFMIGLHPPAENAPPPGTGGSTQIGLNVHQPIEEVVAQLRARGVNFHGPVVEDKAVRLAFFNDPDGNVLYLCETKW
jgi:catechol 2,3-dioxygenase-like lactoylglutathione lyase family enzyme